MAPSQALPGDYSIEVDPLPTESKLTVLWAVDGSAQSEGAISLLRAAVLPVTERLQVLSVAPHSFISGARPDPAFIAKASRTERAEALSRAEQTAARELMAMDPPSRIRVEAVARWGHPIKEILKAANGIKADLIVMGAKGHSNLRLMLLGSVAQGVAQYATRPLLIARPVRNGLARIVCGYHGSAPAQNALRFLNDLTIPHASELILANVVEPFTVPASTPVTYRKQALAEAQAINEARHAEASRILEIAASELVKEGRHASMEVLAGTPSSVLDDLAEKRQADLIIVGSRKPSAAGHYLLGSVAEKLVRHAHASVLVVR